MQRCFGIKFIKGMFKDVPITMAAKAAVLFELETHILNREVQKVSKRQAALIHSSILPLRLLCKLRNLFVTLFRSTL